MFAISGDLAAERKSLDLLDRHPIFWIADAWYSSVIIVSALATIWYTRHKEPPEKALLMADALDLAVFAIAGTQITQEITQSEVIIVIMAAITGTVGGLIRDVLSNEIPLIMRHDIYATASLSGASVYLILQFIGLSSIATIILSMELVIGLCLAAIQWNWHLPIFKLKD